MHNYLSWASLGAEFCTEVVILSPVSLATGLHLTYIDNISDATQRTWISWISFWAYLQSKALEISKFEYDDTLHLHNYAYIIFPPQIDFLEWAHTN